MNNVNESTENILLKNKQKLNKLCIVELFPSDGLPEVGLLKQKGGLFLQSFLFGYSFTYLPMSETYYH